MTTPVHTPKRFMLSALFAAVTLLTVQAHAASTLPTPVLASDSIIDSIDRLGQLTIEVPATQYFETDHGVQVAFTPLTELPIIDVSLHFATNAAADGLPAGTANMVATMLTQGSGSLSEDDFIQASESLGIVLSEIGRAHV